MTDKPSSQQSETEKGKPMKREMHSFCKRFDIPLDVERGTWIRL